MTDRELLERAAKAAGMETRWERVTSQLRARVPGSGDAFPVWSPLTDDGDALRLAVKLGIRVEPSPRGCGSMWPCPQGVRVDTLLNSVTGTDSCATARRVIVRAAAAMGEP